MKKTKGMIVCTFISLVLLLPPTLAISEEKTTVSRIVGESPHEMLKQLQQTELNIDHATFFGHITTTLDLEKKEIVETKFNNNFVQKTGWTRSNLDDKIEEIKNNELIVLETDGNIDPLTARSDFYILFDKEITPLHIRSWQDTFEKNNPLLMFDSPFAGAFLPKQDSFIQRLVRDATIVAPASFSSPKFTTSFLCKLESGRSIGKIFKEARNFHYNGGSLASPDNLPGLILQSYTLYGNPLQVVNMPYVDRGELDQQCKNHLQNLAPNTEYLGPAGNFSRFRKHVTFQIPSYNIVKVGNFSIINTTNTFQNLVFDELVLPVAVRTTKFPAKTIITNITIDKVTDPASITVTTLPSHLNQLTNRTCYVDNSSWSINFQNSYVEDDLHIIANILPIEVINCTQGKFKLYKTINYSIDYIDTSPIYIKEINASPPRKIGDQIDLQVILEELTNNTQNGTLQVKNENNSVIVEIETNTSILTHNISFFAQAKEGVQKYLLEFAINDSPVHSKKFDIKTRILEIRSNISQSHEENTAVRIDFFSYHNVTFELTANYFFLKDNTLLANGTFVKDITPGRNSRNFTFQDLKREDQNYNLILELNYLNHKKASPHLITTNNVPALFVVPPLPVDENEFVIINFTAYDADDDTIMLAINDSRFTKDGNAYIWKTNYTEAGNYTVKLTAKDGLLENEKTASFEVKDKIPPYNAYGTLKFVNGSNVADNLSFTATINNSIILAALTKDGKYNITIDGDLISTAIREGGKPNEQIEVFIGDFNTNRNLTWISQKSEEVNLVAIDLCPQASCNSHCQGSTYFSQGACSRGTCSYTQTKNASSCGYGKGKLKIELVTQKRNVSKDKFFPFKAKVTCLGSDCGRINVTLDPIITEFDDNEVNITWTANTTSKIKKVTLPKKANVKKATVDMRGFESPLVWKEIIYSGNVGFTQAYNGSNRLLSLPGSQSIHLFNSTKLQVSSSKVCSTNFQGFNGNYRGLAMNEKGELWTLTGDFGNTGFREVTKCTGTTPCQDDQATCESNYAGCYDYTCTQQFTIAESNLGGASDTLVGIAARDDNLYVAAFHARKVFKYDSSGNLQKTYALHFKPSGIEFDGTYLYVAEYAARKFHKIQESSGNIVATYAIPTAGGVDYFLYGLYLRRQFNNDYLYAGTLNSGALKGSRYEFPRLPDNISIDTNADGSNDFTYSGRLSSTRTNIDLNTTALAQCTRDCEEPSGNDCLCTISFSSQTAGAVELSNLKISYTLGNVTVTSARIENKSTTELQGFCNATDPDEEKIHYHWIWYKDGRPEHSGDDSSTAAGIQWNDWYATGTFDPEHPGSHALDGNVYTYAGVKGDASEYLQFNYSVDSSVKVANLTVVMESLEMSCEVDIYDPVTGTWSGLGFTGSGSRPIPTKYLSGEIVNLRAHVKSKTGVTAGYCRFFDAKFYTIAQKSHNSGIEVNVENITIEENEDWILSCQASKGAVHSSWLNHSESKVFSPKKGVIPENEGIPFYVKSSKLRNPTACFLKENQTCLLEWHVNATGELNKTYEFFVIGSSDNLTNESKRINITITDSNLCETCTVIKGVSIPLVRGWNLMSLPFITTNKTLLTILKPIEGRYNKVMSYDNGSWTMLDESKPINASSSFWIRVNQSTKLTMNGTRQSRPKRNIRWGINMVAHQSTNSTNVTKDYKDYEVYTFINGTWTSYNPDKPTSLNTLHKLHPGRGYIVKKS